MWCDDFDGDLYRLVPGAREAMGEAADVPLWTVAHTTDGVLNHPMCWNTGYGPACFVGLTDQVDEWKPAGYVGAGIGEREPVRCTWEQLVRDLWVHNVDVILEMELFWRASMLQQPLDRLLGHARGWRELGAEELARWQELARAEVLVASHHLQTVIAVREAVRQEDEHLATLAKGCECCIMCINIPCAGVQAGGFCDQSCYCEDDIPW